MPKTHVAGERFVRWIDSALSLNGGSELISRPFHGLYLFCDSDPSDESLGYFRAFAADSFSLFNYQACRTLSINSLRFSTGCTPVSAAFRLATNAGTPLTPKRAASPSSARTLVASEWLRSACRSD